MTLYKRFTLVLFVICLTLSAMPTYATVLSQNNDPGDFTFSDCEKIDEEGKNLAEEIKKIASSVVKEESRTWEIQRIVDQEWTRLGLDLVVNNEVKRAVDKRREDEGYWTRFWSGWSEETANELTNKIVEDAFSSEVFTKKIDELSLGVTSNIIEELEASFAKAASIAFLCMRAYASTKYSKNLIAVFEQEISSPVRDTAITTPDFDLSIPEVHSKALGGMGIIVVSQISRQLGSKIARIIGQRIVSQIAGRVLARVGAAIVPVAGWVIGLGLIVWDLWEGGKGALPQIQEELQSEELKVKIRDEISSAVISAIDEGTPDIARELANTLTDEWENFCQSRRYMCLIASENHTFQMILDNTPLDQIEDLELLLNIYMDNTGRVELEQALQSGDFEKILILSTPAFEILRTTKSSEKVLGWANLAGRELSQVVRTGLHLEYDPKELDKQSLATLFDTSTPVTTITDTLTTTTTRNPASATSLPASSEQTNENLFLMLILIILFVAAVAYGFMRWHRLRHLNNQDKNETKSITSQPDEIN